MDHRTDRPRHKHVAVYLTLIFLFITRFDILLLSAYFLFLLLTLSSSSSAAISFLHSFVFIEGEGLVRIKNKTYWIRFKIHLKMTSESKTLYKIKQDKYTVNVCIVSVTLMFLF